MWIARDFDGTLKLFYDKPRKLSYVRDGIFDYFCANINNPNRGIYFSLNQIKEWLKK